MKILIILLLLFSCTEEQVKPVEKKTEVVKPLSPPGDPTGDPDK